MTLVEQVICALLASAKDDEQLRQRADEIVAIADQHLRAEVPDGS